jgi:hypothetical protein
MAETLQSTVSGQAFLTSTSDPTPDYFAVTWTRSLDPENPDVVQTLSLVVSYRGATCFEIKYEKIADNENSSSSGEDNEIQRTLTFDSTFGYDVTGTFGVVFKTDGSGGTVTANPVYYRIEGDEVQYQAENFLGTWGEV